MMQARPARRVDASMDLLNDIINNPIDPDYQRLAEKERSGTEQAGQPTAPKRSVVVAVVLLAFGVMAGTSLAQTLRPPLQAQQERDELLQRVESASATVDGLQVRLAELTATNRALTEELAGGGSGTAGDVEAASGAVAVSGPGIVVVVDDGAGDERQARVVDADLRQLVNQFWRSGAEAIAVNGHRLSARTAIRNAGDAITVDYRSLTRPYRVEVIGDADAMIAGFPSSAGGQWWAYLRQNYGVDFELTRANRIEMPADPELRTERARAAR